MSGSRQKTQSGSPPVLRGFISYAHRDDKLYTEFRDHLKALEREFQFGFFDDQGLRHGDRWDPAIKQRIAEADIIVMVLSPAFMASDYIMDEEVPAILARERHKNVLVVPVLLKHCRYTHVVGELQVEPHHARLLRAIDLWKPKAAGHCAAAEAIAQAIETAFPGRAKTHAWLGPLVGEHQYRDALYWIAEAAQLTVAPGGSEGDARAARDPSVRARHEKIKALAAHLARWEKSGRPSNRPILPFAYNALADAAAAFVGAVAPDTEDMVRDIDGLDEAFRAVEDFRAFVGSGMLPDETARDLTALLDVAEPWMREFPTLLERLEGNVATLLRLGAPEGPMLDAAEGMAGLAFDVSLIPAGARDRLLRSVAAARKGGPQADAAALHAIKSARNLLIKMGSVAAGFMLGGIVAKSREARLLDRIRTLLAREEPHIGHLSAGLTPAMRQALGRLREASALDGIGAPAVVRGEPPKVIQEGPDLPEMVLIPKGRFVMGVPRAESEREGYDDDDARPRRKIVIAAPFYMARNPVTRGQFAAFVRETGYDAGPDWQAPGFEQTDDHPVVWVSYDDALAYIGWLNTRKTQGGYRLPSEAEWEYAARAGTRTARYWGDGFEDAGRYAWTSQNGTAPVGQREANGFGLNDMLGNVWEWCADPWHDNYTGRPGDGSVWESGGDSGRSVLRGGSWAGYPRGVRAGVRYYDDRGTGDNSFGFRLSRTLFPPAS